VNAYGWKIGGIPAVQYGEQIIVLRGALPNSCGFFVKVSVLNKESHFCSPFGILIEILL
jgi:hypothetical protein